MKQLIQILLVLIIAQYSWAQKWSTRAGVTSFQASVETFEPVEAINKSTTVLLNTQNGHMAALLFMKAFRFKVALMEEHFNENYIESDQFPKAMFKGKLIDFKYEDLSDASKSYLLEGIITLRNISKNISTWVVIKKDHGLLKLKGNFTLDPNDFNIDIPTIVRKKIANTIKITMQYELQKKV